ncbi:MAG: alpha/beta hydrolase [Stappiaceae bacterium]|uniref:alpha/beta fold hydrolase n=1 Tax=Roseibium sp. TaxID=1936156 RepID=UPI003296D4A7
MAIFSRYLWRLQENDRKTMTGMARRDRPGRMLQLKYGQTHYELDKEPDKPLLICIHGWSTASYVWDPLKPLLRAKGYRVLTYDLYGRGYSDRPDVLHSAELFTYQLTELLNKLGLNDTKLNVIGYSMGGAIAARFVSERLEDVERLLLIAPAGMEVRSPGLRRFVRNNPKFSNPHIQTLLPLVLRAQFRSAAAGFKGNQMVQKVARKQKRELEFRGYLPSLLSSLNGALASKMKTEHEKIAGAKVAVRAIFADQDKTVPYPTAKRLFDKWNPNGVSQTITGAGHAITYTHAQQIMKEVAEFFQLSSPGVSQ